MTSDDFTSEQAIALDRIANAIALYARVQAAIALINRPVDAYAVNYDALDFLKMVGASK